MAESGGQSIAREADFLDGRHDGHVAEVRATRATEVRLGETYNLRSTFVVAGTPVPAGLYLCRTGIHHAERHIGAHEDMAVVTGADAGIDVLGERLCRGRQRQHGEQ